MLPIHRSLGLLSLFALLTFSQSTAQTRYKEQCFENVLTQMDVYYRNAPDFKSDPDSLFMDIYEPSNDNETARPAVMMLFGGAYIHGSRKDALITAYSNYLARCGFIVFAIDYRIGIDSSAAIIKAELPKAVYRAIQDSRAAVRFIRKNSSVFGVDTNKIFALGYSAGAITLLHHAYVSKEEAASNVLLTLAAAMLKTELDDGENLDYSSKLNGLVSICGGIADTSWINSGDAPVLCFHGTNDKVVPYGTDYIFSDSSTTILHGSSVIYKSAQNKSIKSELVTFDGADHSLEGEPRNVIPDKVSSFLFDLMEQNNIRNSKNIAIRRVNVRSKMDYRYFDIAGRAMSVKKSIPSKVIFCKKINGIQPLLVLK